MARLVSFPIDPSLTIVAYHYGEQKALDFWSTAYPKKTEAEIRDLYKHFILGSLKSTTPGLKKVYNFFRRITDNALAEAAVAAYFKHPRWSRLQNHIELSIMTQTADGVKRTVRCCATRKKDVQAYEVSRAMLNDKVHYVVWCQIDRDRVYVVGWITRDGAIEKGVHRQDPLYKKRVVTYVDRSLLKPMWQLDIELGFESNGKQHVQSDTPPDLFSHQS